MKGGTNSAPTAWDVDRDGEVEIIVPCEDGTVLYCFSSTGTERWRFEFGDQPGQTVASVADIDKDGEYEIVVLVPDELRVYCLTFYGTEKWRFDLDPAAAVTGYIGPYQGATLGDIDGDGYMETFVSDLGMGAGGPEPHLYCINHDGTLKWTAEAIGFTIMIGDFTGDGKMNVVGGRHFWMVIVLDANGQPEYVWDHSAYDPNIPIDPSFGAPLWGPSDTTQIMGDVDGDGKTELVLEGEPGSALWCFTANGDYDPDKMVWTRGNNNAANVAVIPIAEGIILPLATIALLGLARGIRA
jgi:outer membrane protein assembly factor BamB